MHEIKQVVSWKESFDEVIDHYQSLKSSVGGVKGLDYSRSGGGGNSANMIVVSPSDFICDVELAARRALSDKLYHKFVACYVDCVEEPDTEDREIDAIRTNAGRIFTEKRIYPVAGYFKPKAIDRGKKTRGKKTK